MSFAARRDFDAWFSENYDDLVQTAFALHPDAYDLVHHTYLKIAEGISKGHKVQNLPGYFHTAMWKHSANKFRKLYARGDAPQKELVSDYDLRDAIRKEEALLMANHLKWFDRKVLELYLEGWSMAEVSQESGVSVDVFYKSIQKSKEKLRHVIRQRTKEGR